MVARHAATSRRLSLVALVLAGCAGVDQMPSSPPSPPPLPRLAAIDVAIPDAAASEAETAPELPVLLLAGSPIADPAPVAALKFTAPKSGQVLPSATASDATVKFDVRNAPAGATIRLVLDGRPAKTHADLREPIRLGDLARTPLGEGHHVLVACLARTSGESLKGRDAHAIVEFHVGKKTPASVDFKKPYLVLLQPADTYSSEDASDVPVDALVIASGEKKHRVTYRLEGPGIEAPLRATAGPETPHAAKNLRPGAYTLRAEILGDDGKALTAPSSVVTRAITVTETATSQAPRGDAGPAGRGARP